MEGKQRKLARNAAIYSFFTLLQRGLGFFLLPVYTTVLATEQLGIISTTTAVVAFIVLIFGLALRGSTAYYYYEYKDKQIAFLKQIYGTNVIFILLFSVLGIGFLLLTKPWILDFLLEDIPFSPYIILALSSIFLQPLYFFYQSILKAKQNAKKAAGLDFVYFGIMIGLTLILILGFGFEAEGALLANAVASLSVFVISLIGLRKEITFCFKLPILKKTLAYSLPVLPHNISGWTMNMVDKIILNNIGSLSLVALFDVGAQIGKVVNMISLGVNSAYSPWFFDQVKNNPNGANTIAKVTEKIVLLYVTIAIAVSWISPELLQIISKPVYHDSWKIVPIISTAFVINGFYFSFSNVFFLEKTRYLPLLTITGAIVNIVLNIWLIPLYGIFGAAVASLATKFVFAGITYWVSQKLYKINYRLYYFVILILIGFVISGMLYLIQPKINELDLLWAIMLKAIVLLSILLPMTYKNIPALLLIFKNKKINEQ